MQVKDTTWKREVDREFSVISMIILRIPCAMSIWWLLCSPECFYVDALRPIYPEIAHDSAFPFNFPSPSLILISIFHPIPCHSVLLERESQSRPCDIPHESP
jgi:hypothetical protein